MWKSISGFKNYEINSLGQIRNIKNNNLISPFNNGRDYQCVYLYLGNGTRKIFRLHRLVANAFLPNIEGKHFVDHVNRNRSDNTIANLRWATRIENNDNRISARGSICRHCGMKQ